MSVMISAAVFIAAMIACMAAGIDTVLALLLGIVLATVSICKNAEPSALQKSIDFKVVPLHHIHPRGSILFAINSSNNSP